MKKQQRTFQKELITKGTIGSGTFGTVKKCIWKKTDQMCAVKCIDNVNGMNIDKIQQQAVIMQNAQSDYSLELYDHFFDEENSQYVFIMPYCKFGSIQKKLNDNWTLQNLLLFIYQITQAFIDFSQKQIIHLDLKPQNILLKGPGQYLVCDFGCSKVIQDLAVSKNYLRLSLSKGLGTPEYAAPQIEMNTQANKYSDVWSLGIILYKMIYHKTPFKKNIGLAFGAYKTTFQGHKPQLQPIVSLLKGMICLQKRTPWKEIRKKVFDILKIDNQLDIITSTDQYVQYVSNMSILGTCFIHHIDRIKEELQISGIDDKSMLRVLLYFLLKLTQSELNKDMFYCFPFTWNRMKNDYKLKIEQMHQQIFDMLIQRQLISQKLDKYAIKQLKLMLVKQTKIFAQKIKTMPELLREKIEKTPTFQFFKVKKMIYYICQQNGNNLGYHNKRQLSQTVKYLIYS